MEADDKVCRSLTQSLFKKTAEAMREKSATAEHPISFCEGIAFFISKAYLTRDSEDEPAYGHLTQRAA